MEAYERIKCALNEQSPHFQEANEYYINLKQDNILEYIREIVNVFETDEIPFEERLKLTPIFSSFFPKKDILNINSYAIKNDQQLCETISLLLIPFLNTDAPFRYNIGHLIGKFRFNASLISKLFSIQLISDLFDKILDENSTIAEKEGSIIAASTSLFTCPMKVDKEFFEKVIDAFASIEIRKEIADHIIHILSIICYLGSIENVLSSFALILDISKRFPVDMKQIKYFINNSYSTFAKCRFKLFMCIFEIVAPNFEHIEFLSIPVVKIHFASDSVKRVFIEGHENEMLDLIIQIIPTLIETYDEDETKEKLDFLKKILKHINIPMACWETVQDFLCSVEYEDHFVAAIVLDSVICNRNYLEETEVSLNAQKEAYSHMSEILTVLLDDDDDEGPCLKATLELIAKYSIPNSSVSNMSNDVIEAVFLIIESPSDQMSELACEAFPELAQFLNDEESQKIFESVLELIVECEDDKRLSNYLTLLRSLIFIFKDEIVVEKYSEIFELIDKAIQDPEALYFSAAIDVLIQLLLIPNLQVEENIQNILDIGISLIDTDREDDGIALLRPILIKFGRDNLDLIETVGTTIMKRLESPINSHSFNITLQCCITLLNYVNDEDLLRKIACSIFEAINNLDNIESSKAQISRILIKIAEFHPVIVEENLLGYVNNAPGLYALTFSTKGAANAAIVLFQNYDYIMENYAQFNERKILDCLNHWLLAVFKRLSLYCRNSDEAHLCIKLLELKQENPYFKQFASYVSKNIYRFLTPEETSYVKSLLEQTSEDEQEQE